MNIVDLIIAENTGHTGTALIEGGRTVTYPELFASVHAAVRSLEAVGIGGGCYVVICLRGGIDYIVISLAVLLCGGVLVPVIETAGDDEIRDVCRTIGADIVICRRKITEFSPVILDAVPFVEGISVFQVGSVMARDPRLKNIDAAFVRFSSGTTGASKGVVLSHQAIRERTDAADKALAMGRGDRVIWVLNMSFHFVVTILLFLRRGSAIVICEDDFPRSFISTITQGCPTFLYASPFHYSLLTKTEGLSRDVFKHVRLAVSTAMSLSVEGAGGFYAAFGLYPSQAYGIIEVGLPCVNTSQEPSRILSVGKLLPDYQLKLQDADDSGCGRIFLKGPGLFDAYLKPIRLAGEVLEAGWFDTGDVGRVDAEGFLFITGRTKNVINFCGMKVFPEEVENMLNRFPGVKESRVYGKPHPQYGQIVCAEMITDGPIVLDDLRLECYRKLARYKVPKEYSFVTSFPKTPSGKLKRI
ncbi:MAG: acyl--CoA ligase [Candidatus Omnitrophica bacterium]|nr:acyl--CoA ligase [Candidatus Omnitrophota bacterium]